MHHFFLFDSLMMPGRNYLPLIFLANDYLHHHFYQVIEPNELVLTAEFLDLLAPPPASDWPAVQSHPMDQYKNAASDTAEAGAQDQSSTSESKSSSSSSASSADADSDAVADDVDPAADAEVVLEQCNIFYQEVRRSVASLRH